MTRHPTTTEAFHLTVETAGFRTAAGLFERWLPRNQWSAHCGLWLDGRDLVVRVGNDEACIPATGTWPGTVVTTAGWFIAAGFELPETQGVELSIEGSRLRLGTPTGSRAQVCSVHASRPSWPEFIEPSAPFTLLEMLLLPQRFSGESIEYSGLREEVAGCAMKLGNLLDEIAGPIGEAAHALKLEATQVWQVFRFLVGPGLEELQRRQ